MRRYKKAVFQEYRKIEGSYRNYRFKIDYINQYINDRRSIRRAYRRKTEGVKVIPPYLTVYSVGYIKLKPCNHYLMNQTDLNAHSHVFNSLVNVPGIDISYDETDNHHTGKGRWIGFALNSFYDTYIGHVSYIDAIKYVKKVIDDLIELREGN